MLLASVIVAFVLGCLLTLLVQFLFARRWMSRQPCLFPPYKQQYEKVQLPPILRKLLSPKCEGRGELVGGASDKKKNQSLILNALFQFLFAELKDTDRVRRWAAHKMNVEFEEMLASTAGKLINQIQVRDFNFGSSFPIVEAVELKNVRLSQDEDIIQTVDVALDIDYEGGFQLTLDVDVIFGAWAYLSITVTKLAGRARLQMTRLPFTHWSFSFYEEPKMEFSVDSRFNGRPIPQISSLIVNQIKRTINKKHVLPSYKMRYKPMFIKPEESFINPDLCFHGNKLGAGTLSVKVLKCSRLLELSSEGKLFCTLSVDKEEIEEVWRQSWTTLDVTLKFSPHQSSSGLTLKDQLSGDRTEKKRVVIENILPNSAACSAGLQRGDIVETIGDVRVLSFKHAAKQLRNAGESVTLRIRRQSRQAYDPEHLYGDQPIDLEVEECDIDSDVHAELGDFVNIDLKHPKSSPPTASLHKSPPTTLQTPKSTPVLTQLHSESDSLKLRDKLTRKIQSGKKKLLGMKDDERNFENSMETKDSTSTAASLLHDRSQSAKSSPQKQLQDISRQRAHSDTSLNKASDAETESVSSDTGNYSYIILPQRIGEVSTREISFTSDPEWNEEFEFDCKEEDNYVNVCVWCKMAQRERSTKNLPTMVKSENQQKAIPPVEDIPSYNVTTKIGYVSIPLSDIAAGCLLTMQGDTQYTMYLQPPEETITVSRTKIPLAGHIGFDSTRCHGDITLSFVHKPFKLVDTATRKEIVRDILNPPPAKMRAKSLERVRSDDRHNLKPCQFTTRTLCDLCGKKIWLKGGFKCNTCDIVCHKKCVEKCNVQTKCSKEGPKIASQPTESWVRPRGNEGDKEEGKVTRKFWKFRQGDQPSLPLNIPSKGISASRSPVRSPSHSPSPSFSMVEQHEGHLTVTGLRKNLSNKSLQDEDSDEEFGYRQPTFSLDDHVVIEAKEKGKQLYADLTLPERKKTLDDMVTKLQDTIDKESESKAELMKQYQDTTDTEQKRIVSQQLEKCDDKMEALMMMMVHYCAGLQHCLDQEEAHKRLQGMEPVSLDVDSVGTDDAGIQFVVSDT